ncbi:MAG: ABC transporter permease [Candidatus Solibacter sp.]
MRIEHWLYELPLRLRSLFRRKQVEQDLDEELQYHLDHKIEQFIAQGMAPGEARLAALRAMDGLTQRKEECRDMRKLNLLDDMLQDVRYAVRVLAKAPGFTAVAVLTLALAMGANSVVFGILNALILRPIDVPQADSLYSLQRKADNYGAESYPNYLDLRERNRSFEDLAGYTIWAAALDSGNSPARVWIEMCTGNYFDVLRIQPHLGRFFHGSDEHGPNSAPYIVLSYAYWQTHFQGDRGAVGRVVRVNKHPFTVLGVAPPEFHGTLLFLFPDFFLPLVNQQQLEGVDMLNARGNRWVFQVLGHLKPGVSVEQAAADLNSIGSVLARNYPKEVINTNYVLGRPTFNGDFLGRPIRAFVSGLMLMAGLILLAACANLGSLFAARASDRSREVALRLALGAGRGRILRQLLTEAMIISLMGGAVGLWGSIALLRSLSNWQPLSRFPIHVPVHPDQTVYAVALGLALVSGVLFGLVPARQVRRTDPYQIIKAGPTGIGGRRFAMRDALLVVQVAICALLVTSSLVAARGMLRSITGNLGFEPRGAMLANTTFEMAGYTGDTIPAMQKRMIEAMETLPGVTSVALTSTPPLDQAWQNTSIYKDETSDLRPSNVAFRPFTFRISPSYFQTAGTRLLAGRSLTWHDDVNTPHVAVINEVFARSMFGSVGNAMGRYFKLKDGIRIEVVGVAENGKYMSLTEDPQPAMFFPILQSPANDSWLIVRSDRDTQELAGAIRQKLHDLDASMPAFIVTWKQDLEGALFASRVATVALGIMGLLGAVLAVTGVFGMAAYSVSKRLKELGIRMALGAQPREVLSAGLGRAFKLLAFGSAAGVVLGVLFTRVLAAIVYQATPRDPLVLGGVLLSMLVLGLLATWIPARRALSLNPLALLREE